MNEKKYIDLKEDPKIQQWIKTFSECQQEFNRDQLKLISQHCFLTARTYYRFSSEFSTIAQRSQTEFMVNLKKLLQYCLDKNCKHDIDDVKFLEGEYSLLVDLLNHLHFHASLYIFCTIF